MAGLFLKTLIIKGFVRNVEIINDFIRNLNDFVKIFKKNHFFLG